MGVVLDDNPQATEVRANTETEPAIEQQKTGSPQDEPTEPRVILTKSLQKSPPHLVYAGTLLLVALMYFGYNIWKDAQVTERARIEAQQKTEIEQAKMQEAEKSKQDLLQCLADARTNYTTNWATQCEANAKKTKQNIASCLSSGFSTEESCRALWGTPDPSPECTLPQGNAETEDTRYKNAKEDCYKQYPQKPEG